MGIILIIILVILLVGTLPTWRHSKSWGPYSYWELKGLIINQGRAKRQLELCRHVMRPPGYSGEIPV
jgi:hypothetical protein